MAGSPTSSTTLSPSRVPNLTVQSRSRSVASACIGAMYTARAAPLPAAAWQKCDTRSPYRELTPQKSFRTDYLKLLSGAMYTARALPLAPCRLPPEHCTTSESLQRLNNEVCTPVSQQSGALSPKRAVALCRLEWYQAIGSDRSARRWSGACPRWSGKHRDGALRQLQLLSREPASSSACPERSFIQMIRSSSDTQATTSRCRFGRAGSVWPGQKERGPSTAW